MRYVQCPRCSNRMKLHIGLVSYSRGRSWICWDCGYCIYEDKKGILRYYEDDKEVE